MATSMRWKPVWLSRVWLHFLHNYWSEQVGKTGRQLVHSNESGEIQARLGLVFYRIVGVNALLNRLHNSFTPTSIEKIKLAWE